MYRPNKSLIPKQQSSSLSLWYNVGRKLNAKKLEQQINITFCVKTDKSASKTLALLTLVYAEYTMKKLNVF
jgi:hypothetical protein